MNHRRLGILAVCAAVFAACSSSRGSAPLAPLAAAGSIAATPRSGPAATASGTLTLTFPSGRSKARVARPAYISPSTTYVTLFIDAAATGFRQACTQGSPCSINWTSTSGSHVFAVEIDDSAGTTGGGTVLGEGSETVSLTAGTNNLAPLTLNGVPAQLPFVGETGSAAGSSTCMQLSNSNCVQVTYGVTDADGNFVVLPGSFDDGGITMSTSGAPGVAKSPSYSAPDSAGNDYAALFGCGQSAGGTFTASPVLVNPSAVPELSSTQLATYNLTYPNQTSLRLQNWPTYTCTSGALSYPGSLAIYVANGIGYGSIITQFSPFSTGNVAPLATLVGSQASGDLNVSDAVALDSKDNLYVANYGGEGSISVFPPLTSATPSNEMPSAFITGPSTGLFGPLGIAVDSIGRIYVLNQSSITVYAANPVGTLNESPIATITDSTADWNSGCCFIRGMALDANGDIYVTDEVANAIYVFAANPLGTLNEAPIATISGNTTGLTHPYAIAVDSSGKIYVTNINNSITVYPAHPSGPVSESPIATIFGSNTGINTPYGIAVDSSGNIYVTNWGSRSITIFPPNPSGTMNETPYATIQGSNTQLYDEANYPFGIAVH